MPSKQVDSEPLYHSECLIPGLPGLGGTPELRDATCCSSCLGTLVLCYTTAGICELILSFPSLTKKTGKQPCFSVCTRLQWLQSTGNTQCDSSASPLAGVGILDWATFFGLPCLTKPSRLGAWCRYHRWLCSMNRWTGELPNRSFKLSSLSGEDPASSQALEKCSGISGGQQAGQVGSQVFILSPKKTQSENRSYLPEESCVVSPLSPVKKSYVRS